MVNGIDENIVREGLNISELKNSVLSNLSESPISKVLPPELVANLGTLITILKAVSIVFLVYLVFLIFTSIMNIIRNIRIKKIYNKVNEIDEKINVLIERQSKKNSGKKEDKARKEKKE